LIESERAEEIERAEVPPIIEPRGDYAYDLMRFAIDPDDAPDDIVFASEALLPATVTDNNNAVVARKIFAREEIAAELRLDSED
jgi:hypothetical protein